MRLNTSAEEIIDSQEDNQIQTRLPIFKSIMMFNENPSASTQLIKGDSICKVNQSEKWDNI